MKTELNKTKRYFKKNILISFLFLFLNLVSKFVREDKKNEVSEFRYMMD